MKAVDNPSDKGSEAKMLTEKTLQSNSIVNSGSRDEHVEKHWMGIKEINEFGRWKAIGDNKLQLLNRSWVFPIETVNTA